MGTRAVLGLAMVGPCSTRLRMLYRVLAPWADQAPDGRGLLICGDQPHCDWLMGPGSGTQMGGCHVAQSEA